MGDLSAEILANLPMDFSKRYFYNEPKDILESRIKLSLPAMTEFLLDESIESFNRYSYAMHPLFLSMSNKGCGGREIWIDDIEHFRYKPAYTNLREVWLHDYNKELANKAFFALSTFNDEKLLFDIEKKFSNATYDWRVLDDYVHAVGRIDHPLSVDIILNVADFVRLFNDASLYNVTKEGKLLKQDSTFSYYPGSSLILEMVWSLGFMKNEKAKPAMDTLKQWFSKDNFFIHRCNSLIEIREISEERRHIEEHKLDVPKTVEIYDLSKGDLFF